MSKTVADLSLEELDQFGRELLELVPADGSAKGNTVLLQQLDWNEDVYWVVRDRLIDLGTLERWKGRGGSVRRVAVEPEPTAEPSEPARPEALPRVAEDQLYEPLAKVLRDQWAKDKRYEDFVIEVTARQGARPTGGKWTRPDIVAISFSTFLYVPGKHLDVTTFEVKPHDALDITCVYEALAHRRSGTRSYVLAHVPESELALVDVLLEEICEEAKRHGIGVIVVSDPTHYAQWDERVEASRQELDPYRVNEFLSKQLSETARERILKWSK